MKTSKYTILFIALVFVSLSAFSQSQGPNSPSAAASATSVNGKSWNSPTNVFADDNVTATAVLAYDPICTGAASCYSTAGLAASGFGFTIPSTDIISGIVVEVKRKAQGAVANQVYDSVIMIMKNAVPVGTNEASAVAWNATGLATYTTYGSATDLWGTTWTASDINDVNFGLFLTARNSITNVTPQVTVDHIQITVYYSTALGIENISSSFSDNDFSVYPNPANTGLTINTKSVMTTITVSNIVGEVVYSSLNTNQQNTTEINLSAHPKGIYFVQVVDENKNSSTKKIILQ